MDDPGPESKHSQVVFSTTHIQLEHTGITESVDLSGSSDLDFFFFKVKLKSDESEVKLKEDVASGYVVRSAEK